MEDADTGGSPRPATNPTAPPTSTLARSRLGVWWTFAVAGTVVTVAALVYLGRPPTTVSLPDAADVAAHPVTAAHGEPARGGTVTVVTPLHPVEVYDDTAGGDAPGSSTHPGGTGGDNGPSGEVRDDPSEVPDPSGVPSPPDSAGWTGDTTTTTNTPGSPVTTRPPHSTTTEPDDGNWDHTAVTTTAPRTGQPEDHVTSGTGGTDR